MNKNFAMSLLLVLRHEGGFVDHKSDPGGPTNLGITLATYKKCINPKGTIAGLKALTKEQAGECYRRQFWNAINGDLLPDGVDYAAFDFAVNSGPARAVKYLQSAVGTKQDGKLGPETLAAIKEHPAARLVNALCDSRLVFMRGAKGKDGAPLWPTFGKGWTRRVAECRKEALIMIATAPFAAPVQPVPNIPPPVEPAKPVAPPVGFPVDPGTVVIIKDGSKSKPEGLFWRALWAVLNAIFGRKK